MKFRLMPQFFPFTEGGGDSEDTTQETADNGHTGSGDPEVGGDGDPEPSYEQED